MSPSPQHLAADAHALTITWSDGVTHRLTWQALREGCPCATCKTARQTARPTALLPVLSLAETRPLKPTKLEPVGNYAYSIHFGDGHNTGIYGLDLLRRLGEAAAATS